MPGPGLRSVFVPGRNQGRLTNQPGTNQLIHSPGTGLALHRRRSARQLLPNCHSMLPLLFVTVTSTGAVDPSAAVAMHVNVDPAVI